MGWIAVDLDGTLAHWEPGYRRAGIIGPPIPAMVERVKAWIAEGKEVRIFTSRLSDPTALPWPTFVRQINDLKKWCVDHIGEVLTITAEKDPDCIAIYDDIAHRVEKNTGRLL